MKKVFYLIISIMILITGCTTQAPPVVVTQSPQPIVQPTPEPTSEIIETPRESVRNALNALKSGDELEANRYFNYRDVVKQSSKNEPLYSPFKTFTYKIISVKTESEITSVEIKFTNKDFKWILSQTMDKVYLIIAKPKNAKLSEKKRQEIVRKTFKKVLNTTKKTVTKKVTMQLTKNGGMWLPDMNQSVIDALCGDPDSAKL